MGRNMGVGLLVGMIRASERPGSRIPKETICELPPQAAVSWTNSSSEVVHCGACHNSVKSGAEPNQFLRLIVNHHRRYGVRNLRRCRARRSRSNLAGSRHMAFHTHSHKIDSCAESSGYVGRKKVVPVIIEGLRRLEYRGYDSAGIAVGSPNSATSRGLPRSRQAS